MLVAFGQNLDYYIEKRKRGKYMGFAENLKQIRKQNNLSQEDLAELLDVSRQAVSKWEQGGSLS